MPWVETVRGGSWESLSHSYSPRPHASLPPQSLSALAKYRWCLTNSKRNRFPANSMAVWRVHVLRAGERLLVKLGSQEGQMIITSLRGPCFPKVLESNLRVNPS